MVKNKRGDVENILMIFFVLAIVLVIGLVIGVGAWIYTQTINPVVSSFKEVGQIDEGTNMTEITALAGDPYVDVSNSFTWITGIFYFILIVGSIGFGFYLRSSENKIGMVFYFGILILLLLISILVSNSYQDMYTAGDDLGEYLHTLTLLSWLVLNSPLMIIGIGILTGIIMFTGGDDNGYP